tara:strand:+ start:980 stop:2221 length:1242 start_codon:yes stop_codon:yes gene_type:complete
MSFIKYTITGSTGTINPSIDDDLQIASIEIYAATQVTLTQGLAIAPTTPTAPTGFIVLWNASVLLGGFAVTICGITINQDLADSTGQFLCSYDGSSWTVQAYPDQINNSQVIKGTGTLNIINTGSVTLTTGTDQNYQRASNTVTLTGNSDVSLSTAGATANDWFWIRLDGGVTVGAFTLSVAGIAISEYDALNGGVSVYAFYDGATWRAQQMGGSINAADIPDGTIAVTKFAAIAGYSTYGNITAGSATPTVQTAATTDDVLTATGFAKLSAASFDSTVAPIQQFTTNVSSAEILAAFTTPVVILPAPGVGFINQIHSILAIGAFGTTAYATNLGVRFAIDGAATSIISVATVLDFSGGTWYKMFYPTNVATKDNNNIENGALEFSVPAGNPTAGDSTISFTVFYTSIFLGFP